MFGILIGTACLFGLVKVLRHGRFGHHGFGRHRFGFGRGGFGPRMMLRGLFERLDTTPGQEKVIAGAIADLRAQAADAKSGLVGARRDVAEALRQESFDETLLGGALSRMDDAVDTMRKSALDAFGKVHSALDERQRRILADLIETGPRGMHAHPYRL